MKEVLSVLPFTVLLQNKIMIEYRREETRREKGHHSTCITASYVVNCSTKYAARLGLLFFLFSSAHGVCLCMLSTTSRRDDLMPYIQGEYTNENSLKDEK